MKTVVTLSSLLLATALLLTGHGVQITLLPLKGAGLGLSDTVIGLTGSAYFAGFVLGCFVVPQMIGRVGHIRGFAVLTAVIVTALLSMELSGWWPLWALARGAIGFMMCGLYTVIESWLNDQATDTTRGRVLAAYTFVVLMAMALGQFLLSWMPISTATPIIAAAMLIAMAIVPVGLTRQLAPAPMATTRVSFGLLYRRSKVAFAGALMSGLVTGSFWTLGAVFAKRSMPEISDVSLFIAAAIIGGAVAQYPVGLLSDRFGRPRILVALSSLSVAVCALLALATERVVLLGLVTVFGAVAMPMYALALATVIDKARSGEFVLVGTSVLLLNATGAALAPLFIGPLMDAASVSMLWWSLALTSGLIGFYIFVHRSDRENVAPEEQTPFNMAAPEIAPTAFELDPRGPDSMEEVIEPAVERPAFDDSHAGAQADKA
ncbi:MFS transporter [Aequoribacter fuscus]|nr:MFS transporter [Aequoribacter fuscus]QHJ87395.1 MFS transporter [Aequoribacter fuscus]